MKKMLFILFFIFDSFICTATDTGTQIMDSNRSITLTSSAFKEGEMIPQSHTCEGKNISPDLSWSSLPEKAQSIALITDDPDAPHGTFVHWVVFNIPAHITSLSEGVNIDALGGIEGITNYKQNGYKGPCPPSGTHRYFFKIYALDTKLNLDNQTDKEKLLAAMQGHILAEGQLMGRYKKQNQ